MNEVNKNNRRFGSDCERSEMFRLISENNTAIKASILCSAKEEPCRQRWFGCEGLKAETMKMSLVNTASSESGSVPTENTCSCESTQSSF